MRLISRLSTAVAAAALSVVALTGAASAAGTLNGAGSTAIYPILSVWAQKYHDTTGIAINYQSIGSGGGIAQIKAKTVDFGCTDKPLKRADLAQNNLVQFPAVDISLVPVLHLPGIKPGQIVLDGKTLAAIFLGKIAKWNDPIIKSLNPRVPLPNMAILIVHRSDGSGTTFTFTNYLSKISPEWLSTVGADTSVSWPSGIGGKGNAGVAASVAQTVGSIGYVEYAYALQNNLTYTDMINSSGARVKPTMESFQAAASNADYTKVQDFYEILTNEPGANSWPITGTTWALMRSDYPADKNKIIVTFFDWTLKNGGEDARKLDYVPLPENVTKQIEASWATTLHVTP